MGSGIVKAQPTNTLPSGGGGNGQPQLPLDEPNRPTSVLKLRQVYVASWSDERPVGTLVTVSPRRSGARDTQATPARLVGLGRNPFGTRVTASMASARRDRGARSVRGRSGSARR